MRDALLRIKTDELLAWRVLGVVGVPLLMIGFSVNVPALRNPVFLMIGAVVGFLLPRYWPNGMRFGLVALLAGLALAAVAFIVVTLLTT